MPIAIASWTQELAPGKSYSIDVPRDFRITNAALGDELADAAGRSVVKVSITEPDSDSDSDDEEEHEHGPSAPVKSFLCSLRAGVVEQAALDVTFLEGQTVEFSVSGKNKVYLIGNYIDQGEDDMAPGMMDDLDSDDSGVEEGAFRLEDVSSDVEMDPAELAGLGESDSDDADRFEELPDEPPASKKRALEAPPASKKDKKHKGNDGKATKPASTKPDSKAASKPASKPQSQKPQSHGGKPQSQGKPQANGAGAGKRKSKGDGGKPKSKGGKK